MTTMNHITIQPSATIPFALAKPLSVRIWHWVTALFFIASDSTVIFASTLFETRDNIGLVQQEAQQKGGVLTNEQARSVAHAFSDKLWMTHKFIGYGLCILLLWRIMMENWLPVTSKLNKRLKLTRANNLLVADQGEKTHYRLVQYGYGFFYLIFILMAITGLVLAYEDVEWLKPVHSPAKEVHEFLQYLLYGYAVLHIGGTIWADVTKYPGIVSRMINGREDKQAV